MSETTELTTRAQAVLDQAYSQFKQQQLQRSAEDLFDDAAMIFTMSEMAMITRQYLFEDEIATKVVTLGDQVLKAMYTQASHAEFLKTNFTGNDIRWLLGLPRTHRRHQMLN